MRGRLYLTRPVGDDEDRDERVLEVLKSNRGPLGKKVVMRWSAGAFVAVDDGAGDDADLTAPKLTADQKADAVFLDLLNQRARHNINVTYASAAKAFAETPEAKRARLTKRNMTDALNRLVVAGAVEVFDYRNNSRVAKHIRPVQGAAK